MNNKTGSILWFEDRIHTIEYYIDSFRDLNFETLIIVSGSVVRRVLLDHSLTFIECVEKSENQKVSVTGDISSAIGHTETQAIHCTVVSIDSSFMRQALSMGGPVFVLLDPCLTLSAKEPISTLSLSDLIKVRQLGGDIRFLYSDSSDSFAHDELLANRCSRLPLTFDRSSSNIPIEPTSASSTVIIVSNDERFSEVAASNRKSLIRLCEKHRVSYKVVGINTIPTTGVNSEISYQNRGLRFDLVKGAQLVISTGCEPLNNIDVWLHDALVAGTPILTLDQHHSKFLSVRNNYKVAPFRAVSRALLDVSKGRLDIEAFRGQGKIYAQSFFERQGESPGFNAKLLVEHTGAERGKPDPEVASIGIVCPSDAGSPEFFLARQLYTLLQKDISKEGEKTKFELILFLEGDDSNTEFDEFAGINYRRFTWASIASADAVAAYRFMGLKDRVSGDRLIYIDDQINNGADCALLLFVSDLLPGRLLKTTPTVFISTGKSRTIPFARSFDEEPSERLALQENFDQSDAPVVLSVGLGEDEQSSHYHQNFPNPLDFVNDVETELRPMFFGEQNRDYILLFFEALPIENIEHLVREICELILDVEHTDIHDIVLASISRDNFIQLVNDAYQDDCCGVVSRLLSCKRLYFIDRVNCGERSQLIIESYVYLHLQTEFEAVASLKIADRNQSRIVVTNSTFNTKFLKTKNTSRAQIVLTQQNYSLLCKDIKKVLLPAEQSVSKPQKLEPDHLEYSDAMYLPIVEKWI